MRTETSHTGLADAGQTIGRRSRLAGLPPIPLTPAQETPRRVDSAIWRALRRAAQRVAESWSNPRLADVSPDEGIAPLNVLVEAIRQATQGSPPRSLTDLPTTVPGRRLLEELRGAFLGELSDVSDRIDPQQMIRALRAFEDLQHLLDSDCAHRFTGRLTQPDGPALLVEVAHDMRSPLASILFLVETLRSSQSGPLNAVQDRQLGLVYSAAFGLSALASDIIELSRGGDRLLDANPVPFSVGEIFNGVRDIVLPIAEEKGLEFRLVAPEGDWRLGCPAALHRVLLNLATNALKFTDAGWVEVAARQASRTTIEFSVADTGRGIPPQVVAMLCDPFRTTRQGGRVAFSSAGLGLSICRKLVRGMGGELRVDSTLDVGTRFHFELELRRAPRL